MKVGMFMACAGAMQAAGGSEVRQAKELTVYVTTTVFQGIPVDREANNGSLKISSNGRETLTPEHYPGSEGHFVLGAPEWDSGDESEDESDDNECYDNSDDNSHHNNSHADNSHSNSGYNTTHLGIRQSSSYIPISFPNVTRSIPLPAGSLSSLGHVMSSGTQTLITSPLPAPPGVHLSSVLPLQSRAGYLAIRPVSNVLGGLEKYGTGTPLIVSIIAGSEGYGSSESGETSAGGDETSERRELGSTSETARSESGSLTASSSESPGADPTSEGPTESPTSLKLPPLTSSSQGSQSTKSTSTSTITSTTSTRSNKSTKSTKSPKSKGSLKSRGSSKSKSTSKGSSREKSTTGESRPSFDFSRSLSIIPHNNTSIDLSFRFWVNTPIVFLSLLALL